MSLPKIESPLFNILMPSVNKEVNIRPFLVKEEKILLMGQQAGEDKDMYTAIKQVLNNCIQDKWFDCEMLTTFDMEYMFIKLRARSINNIVTLYYVDNEDEKQYKFDVDLEDVQLIQSEAHETKIEITSDVGIIMRYPTVSMIEAIPSDSSDLDRAEALIRGCISKVYDVDSVYPFDDASEEEKTEFLDNLPIDVYNKVRDFFNTMPKLQYTIKYTNSLKNERTIELKSLKDFFTWG